jgi:hypothetical protein
MKKIILILLLPFVLNAQSVLVKKDFSQEKHFYLAMASNIVVSETLYQLTGKPLESGLIGFLITAAGIVFKEEIYDNKLKKGVKSIADYGAGGLGNGTGSEVFTVRIDLGNKSKKHLERLKYELY